MLLLLLLLLVVAWSCDRLRVRWQSDEYFVLLGATSAMGPLLALLELGANIVAVDLNRPFIWNKLIAAVKNSPGTMYYPLPETTPQSEIDESKIAALAGCNLLTDTARIRNWLVDFMPTKRLTIGGYAYLDGALHVQLAVSMDAIMAGVSARRADTRLCFLCSPTDVFANADEAVLDAQKNYKNAPAWQVRAGFGCLVGSLPRQLSHRAAPSLRRNCSRTWAS